MKIILLQDVARIGRKGSIVEVPDGFAQNKLIPRRMAAPATELNLRKAQKAIADSEAAHGAVEEGFRAALSELKDKSVKIAAEANEKEHLFKAISVDEIVEAAKAMKVTIDSSMVVIGKPIKSLGQHEIGLSWKDLKGTFEVEVVSK